MVFLGENGVGENPQLRVFPTCLSEITMEIFLRARSLPRRLGILPGTFNPPTRAHLILARSALAELDEVLFVLPRVLPHKTFEGASFTQRLRMLETALAHETGISIGASDHGLFIEIARECRAVYGPEAELFFLCGRDAAERVVNWDYGTPLAFRQMLNEFELLVASRGGHYLPPEDFRLRIRPLTTPPDCEEISATEVRRRIALGEPWEHLVPEAVTPLAREIYGRLPAS